MEYKLYMTSKGRIHLAIEHKECPKSTTELNLSNIVWLSKTQVEEITNAYNNDPDKTDCYPVQWDYPEWEEDLAKGKEIIIADDEDNYRIWDLIVNYDLTQHIIYIPPVNSQN
jgi:hypothetical protein